MRAIFASKTSVFKYRPGVVRELNVKKSAARRDGDCTEYLHTMHRETVASCNFTWIVNCESRGSIVLRLALRMPQHFIHTASNRSLLNYRGLKTTNQEHKKRGVVDPEQST